MLCRHGQAPQLLHHLQDTCYHDCHFTPFINDLDEPMDYTVQDGYMISGLESEHDNHAEDRKWEKGVRTEIYVSFQVEAAAM